MQLESLADRSGLETSMLVEEAMDEYLLRYRSEVVEAALSLEGVLSDDEAAELRRWIRDMWSQQRPAS